jgi:hypothetical protein
MAYFEKDKNKIRLNFAKKNNLITEEQYDRILQYLESEEEDVYELGVSTLKGIITKSATQ